MLSAKAKYALHALMFLGRKGEGVSALIRDIGEQERLTRKFLEAILLELKSAGILHARPGKGGGFMLNRPPRTVRWRRFRVSVRRPMRPARTVSTSEPARSGR